MCEAVEEAEEEIEEVVEEEAETEDGRCERGVSYAADRD